MIRYLPLILLLSGCMFSDDDAEKKIESETETDLLEPDGKKEKEAEKKETPTTQPSTFKEFRFERSKDPVELPYVQWEIDGDTLRGEMRGNLLLGFPNVVGNLDKIGDWNLGIDDPCINEIKYEIVEVDPRGPVEIDNQTTSYSISPTAEGQARVSVRAEYTGWEKPGFAKDWMKEGCEDPTYPQNLELVFVLDVKKPEGASFELPELCSDTPTFSEQTTLLFNSRPIAANDKIAALNWTTFPSFTVKHSKMDLGDENIAVDYITSLSQMEPGELKITTEFGDEQIIRVAPFSETESYQLIPYQGLKQQQEVDLTNLVRPWNMYFVFGAANFKTEHCTVQTSTIIESRTPETCVTTSDNWRTQLDNGNYVAKTTIDMITQEGECIIEASTTKGVTQRIAFDIGTPEN